MADKIKPRTIEELLATLRRVVCECTDAYCGYRNTVDTLGGRLVVEERWVPVAESGDRWKGRTRSDAEDCLASYPAGGTYSDGADWDGITHIEHERRYVTAWEIA